MNKFAKLVACLADRMYCRALVTLGVAAGVEHQALLRMLQCRTVLDIGANHGQFSLVARRVSPEARIYSFEPLPTPAGRFRAVFASDPLVTMHQVAIGPERGEATIHISKRDDSSSLLPITVRQTTLFRGTGEAGTASVKVAPLGDFLTEDQIDFPALLKLDVQGFELQALRGCESLLHRFDHVYAECSFLELYTGQALAYEVIAWLRERGFALAGVHNMVYSRAGQAIQGDFLFRSSTDTLRLAHSA